MSKMQQEIAIGSVWDDRDPRQAGRTIEVMDFFDDDGVAYVRARLNTVSLNVSRNAIGRRTTVRRDLFTRRYRPSDEPARRFGTHRETGVLGYWPKDEIAQ